MIRVWLLVLFVLGLVGVLGWATDFVNLQGERTIYTAECKAGEWQGKHCSGTLAPGDRHRFRALKAHGEVLFWVLASSAPSGKFERCDIKDGRNWNCPPSPDTPRAIARALAMGQPVPDPNGRTLAFHPISKWRWMLLDSGITAGSQNSD